jgi:hypothetical protein
MIERLGAMESWAKKTNCKRIDEGFGWGRKVGVEACNVDRHAI